MPPTLDELRFLFAGDWIHDDDRWETTPCYDIGLALEIARRCDTSHEYELRQILYATTPVDEVPAEAIEAIKLAAQRYRQERHLRGLSATRRGL